MLVETSSSGEFGQERLPSLEFTDVFKRNKLSDALAPLRTAFGVDFFDLYKRRYQIDTAQSSQKLEVPVHTLKDFPQFAKFFQDDAKGRIYYQYIDRQHRREIPESQWHDFLIMEQKVAHGKVLAIIDHPGEGQDWFTRVTARKGLSTSKSDVSYLRVLFAGLIPEEYADNYNDDADILQLIEPVTDLSQKRVIKYGLFPLHLPEASINQLTRIGDKGRFLLKDIPRGVRGWSHSTQGTDTYASSDIWLQMGLRSFIEQTGLKGLSALIIQQIKHGKLKNVKDLLVMIGGAFLGT